MIENNSQCITLTICQWSKVTMAPIKCILIRLRVLKICSGGFLRDCENRWIVWRTSSMSGMLRVVLQRVRVAHDPESDGVHEEGAGLLPDLVPLHAVHTPAPTGQQHYCS